MATLRDATDADAAALRDLYLSAFPAEEGASVAQLAIDLLDPQQNPGAFGLMLEQDASVVGHVGFSPVVLDGGKRCSGYLLSPLAVSPDFQKRGLGARLITAGIERLGEQGVNLLFVYGDPEYYGRFGFDAELACRYPAPYALQYPFGWQAVVLNGVPGIADGATLSCVAALRDPTLW